MSFNINSTSYKNTLTIVPVVILANQTLSPEIDLGEISSDQRGASALAAIGFEAGWVGTTEIAITATDIIPLNLYVTDFTTANEVTIPGASASRLIVVPTWTVHFLRKIKLELSVAQTADRTIYLYTQPLYQGAA
jgi:hypothetical protein